MAFLTAQLGNKQQRQHNEDFGAYHWQDGLGCWVVADGLGGHRGGEIASQLAVTSLLQAFKTQPELSVPALQGYLTQAQAALHQRQLEEPRLAEMRTTLVVLVADEKAALWAHVGDSRLYHFRQGKVLFQTKDHSVPQALANAGEISPTAIRFHEDRHRLLRALGQEEGCRPTILPAAVSLQAGDAFLLCTDGFWELVLESEMEEALAGADDPHAWLDGMLQYLTDRSQADPKQNYDNYTAMAIMVS
jgi:serine/threonine protein phosphatase PrpC